MHWIQGVLLRLVAIGFGLFFTYCEADGTYEFLVADQGTLNYIVRGGTGFAIAGALLPMYAGYLIRQRQRMLGASCWILWPAVMALVFYAAVQRTGGAADQAELARLRTTRAGTMAAKTELEVTKAWEEASIAAKTECGSGPAKLRRGPKCMEAEEKRSAAWGRVEKARRDLQETPDVHPDSGARRVAAILPVTESQVRLYQPLLVPVVMALLASVLLSIGTSLRCAPLPSWRGRAPAGAEAPHAERVSGATLSASNGAARVTVPASIPPKEINADPIIAFIKTLVPYVKRQRAEFGEMYDRCLLWWREQRIESGPPTREEFDAALIYICGVAGIRTRKNDGKVFCLDRKLIG